MLAAVKDSVVYGAVEEGSLFIVALDATTGRERWRHLADVGARYAGGTATPATDDELVYFLERLPGKRLFKQSTIVAVDAVTGETRWQASARGLAHPALWRCGDEVCATVVADDGAKVEQHFDRATGEWIRSGEVGLPAGASLQLGSSADGRWALVAGYEPATVAQVDTATGDVAWSLPVERAFASDVSPGNGGSAKLVDGTWVVSLAGRVWYEDQMVNGSYDFKDGEGSLPSALAGLSLSGAVVWQRPRQHLCNFLDGAEWVACDGVERWQAGARKMHLRPTFAEGFDPRTGSATWRLPLDGTFDDFLKQSVQIDDTTFAVRLPGGTTLIDIATGPEGPAPAELTGWCAVRVTPDAMIDNTRSVKDYQGTTVFDPCRLDGSTSPTPSLPVPATVGVRAGGFSVWPGGEQIHGARNP